MTMQDRSSFFRGDSEMLGQVETGIESEMEMERYAKDTSGD